MAKILIGTDPEVFLRDKATGEFRSAAGFFPGTKDRPCPLDRGFIQVDGHALEFNTEPVDNEDEFVEVVTHVFNQVKGIVEMETPSWEIALEPVAHFDQHYFDSLPAKSKELGCSPDFSAETGKVLSSPAIQDVPIRTSSGHIHIGFTKYQDAFTPELFKQRLDIARRVTPYLLEVAKEWEDERSVQRREFYGREMAFRPKHYGVELRALDCLWLENEERIRKVFRTTMEALQKEFPNAL